MNRCELCRREPIEVTRHHLIPRARHRKSVTHRRFTREEANGRIALLCRACHKFVHSQLSEGELANEYNTLDKLLTHPPIATFVRWVSTKAAGLRVQTASKR